MSSHTRKHLNDSQIHILESWEEFQELAAGTKYRGWAFRGQEKSEWPLNSTLSRHLIDYKVHPKVWAHQEERIFRIFCRKAHLFLQHVPDDDDTFQWLALMQHHGAPTRLLDFTWSPFVAAFFALEKARTDCAVWAVSFPKLREMKYEFPSEQLPINAPGPRNTACYERFFLWNKVPFIATGEPFNMSQRLIAQAGTFLVPGVLDQPVEGILSGCRDPEKTIVKFVLKSSKIRDEAMESLYYMNITNATLFPGLDGMARSLDYELEFHWAFNPKTAENYPGYNYLRSDGG